MKSVLMLIISPPESQNAARALKLARDLNGKGNRVGVCFLQDGALLARVTGDEGAKDLIVQLLSRKVDLYVIKDDLRMRGFGEKELIPEAKLVDYHQLVDLLMDRYESILGAF